MDELVGKGSQNSGFRHLDDFNKAKQVWHILQNEYVLSIECLAIRAGESKSNKIL